MRLRRLDLTRYGIFTDRSLDFGAAGGAPDLHIIYGANEAGKSTLRNAINDLLFRIEPQSDYDFLHGYKAMEIGAALDIGERTVEWRRLKRNKDDLLDADGNPANAALLDSALGGMDRQTFELMFSLDGETLKEGGEELHRSRGRLGETLFAATSGLSSISAALDGVRGEADAFFKPRGKKQRLNELKHDLEKLDARLKEVEVSVPEYRKLQETLREAHDAHQEARRDADAIRKRLRQVERWQTALRDGAKLRMARERLAPLCNTPEIPDETAGHIHELDEQAGGLRRQIEQANTDLERHTAERDKLAPDETL
ncbi:MAG: AAA family ATPase, partial [Dichotomicrobium sp.]